MDPDELFLATLADLERRVRSALPGLQDATAGRQERYDALMIAPLLRKLLLDERPLVSIVNTSRKVRVRYPVEYWPVLSGSHSPGSKLRISGPSELAARRVPMVDAAFLKTVFDHFLDDEGPLARDGLLGKPVMMWNGNPVSVRELISHAAHVDGAVHVGSPKDEKGRLLVDLGRAVTIGGYAPALFCLAAIGRIVLIGLQPLRDSVESAIEQRG